METDKFPSKLMQKYTLGGLFFFWISHFFTVAHRPVRGYAVYQVSCTLQVVRLIGGANIFPSLKEICL